MVDSELQFAPLRVPGEDLSGEFGRRALGLLAELVDRDLDAIGARSGVCGLARIEMVEPRYAEYLLGGIALSMAMLARFRPPGLWPEAGDDELLNTAAGLVAALMEMHQLGGGEGWNGFGIGRILYLGGMAAWLLGDRLPEDTRALLARELAEVADGFLGRPAPAQLRWDTQAESNAWHGGGIATVACLLPNHPHRDAWEQKALEYTISAYATAEDVGSDRVVDGRPLREWLTGPNALSDYTVENHGFVHPDYMVSISEMARAGLAYALAGRRIPEGLTFNAGAVFDRYAALTLPDATQLYVQGTDYSARRVDGLFQVGLIALMEPTPMRAAHLWRSLERLERMAEQWPAMPMSGWLGMPCDLGACWGLTQNYLAARLFGVPAEAAPDAEIEARLAGTHISEDGQFLVQRTERSVTSFSWHSDDEHGHVLGLSMPLDLDALCYPMPGSWFGEVECAESAEDTPDFGPCELHRREGANLAISVERCGGRLLQHCAFIALPEGGGVFVSELEALEDVTLTRVTAGTIWLFDDLRWPWQESARTLVGTPGILTDGEHPTRWVIVDDRLGWAVLGPETCTVQHVKGHPTIFRKEAPMYDTLRVDFPLIAEELSLAAGTRAGRFALVIRPGLSAEETETLAAEMRWLEGGEGVEVAGRRSEVRLGLALIRGAGILPAAVALTSGCRRCGRQAPSSSWRPRSRSRAPRCS